MLKKDLLCFLCVLLGLALVLLLTIGIPLLINLSYNHPVTFIKTEWGAAEVLDYYSGLLGTCVTVVTFIVTVLLTVEQIRHQQNYQQRIKLWQETEDAVDICLDTIHPMKLQYAFLDAFSKSESSRAYQLIGQVETYRLNAIVSADRLSRSLNKACDNELEDIANCIIEIKEKLIPIANQYLEVFQDEVAIGMSSGAAFEARSLTNQREQFAENINALDKRVKDIYDTDYLTLIEKKSKLFRKKYEEISQEKPGLFRNKKN